MKVNDQNSEFVSQLRVEPVTRNNWNKFVELFGRNGACGNCWCMYYRLSKMDFLEGKFNDGNKDAIKELVREGKPVGLNSPGQTMPASFGKRSPEY